MKTVRALAALALFTTMPALAQPRLTSNWQDTNHSGRIDCNDVITYTLAMPAPTNPLQDAQFIAVLDPRLGPTNSPFARPLNEGNPNFIPFYDSRGVNRVYTFGLGTTERYTISTFPDGTTYSGVRNVLRTAASISFTARVLPFARQGAPLTMLGYILSAGNAPLRIGNQLVVEANCPSP